MRGVFLDIETIGPDDLDLKPLLSTLPKWSLLKSTRPDDVRQVISSAEVVITNKVRLEGDALRHASQQKLVCVAATGTDHVDLEAADERNITVCNVAGYATASVTEHVFALLLALKRRLHEYRYAIEQGRWQQASGFCMLDYPVGELAGQTLGIIGYGELGKSVATVGKAFGMRIVVAQRPGGDELPGRLPLDDVLATANVISLHCPLTAATRNLINSRELERMREDAILINTARGGIVNEAALLRAIQEGQIGGAAIDVLTEEPPAGGNPLLDVLLPNLIITPHVAWAGIHARQTLVNEIAGNIRSFLGGSPQNVVSA